MKCSNCNTTLSCGCQKKIASNGTACCNTCVGAVNAKAKVTVTVTPTTTKK
jgi:hypothetical protein